MVYSQQCKVNSGVYVELAELNNRLSKNVGTIAELYGILAGSNNKIALFDSTLATTDD